MRISRIVGASLPAVLLFIGAGCIPTPATPRSIEQPQAVMPPPTPAPAEAVDSYDGWGTIMPGNVISLRIPPGCQGDPGAGNLYIVCPTPGNDSPTPDMHISSDGMQVNIRRWEDQEWDQWDKVVASLKVLAPLDRDVQITIQK